MFSSPTRIFCSGSTSRLRHVRMWVWLPIWGADCLRIFAILCRWLICVDWSEQWELLEKCAMCEVMRPECRVRTLNTGQTAHRDELQLCSHGDTPVHSILRLKNLSNRKYKNIVYFVPFCHLLAPHTRKVFTLNARHGSVAAGLAAAKLISRRYRSRSWALLLLPPSPAQHQHQVIQSPAQIISLPRVFINDFSDNWMRHRQPVCLVKAGPRIFDWIMVAKYFSLLSILKHVTFFIKYFCTNLYYTKHKHSTF